jgi:A/G-specific adenine glycosylase
MDLGATLCTPKQPRCLLCPLAELCVARRDGRQDELPGAKPQKAVPTVEIDVAFCARDGRWLLARRAPRGLYGGLWELPEAAALGLRVSGAPIVTHTQKLTHRTLVYRVHVHDPGDAAPRAAAPYDATQYVAPDALADLAVSSATAALARVLIDRGNPWPTPKKRSSSSPRGSRRSSRDSASSATTSTTPTSSTRRRAPRAGSAR